MGAVAIGFAAFKLGRAGAGPILVRVQRNRNKKQFIELGFKSLVWIWVTFPLPIILIFYHNAIRSAQEVLNSILIDSSCLF